MKDETRRQIAGAAGLVWLVLVISLYYVSHKPFEIAFALGLVRVAWQLLVAAGILSLAGALGSFIIPEDDFSPLEALVLQAAFGLGGMSLVWLLIGSTVGFPTWLLAVSLALPLLRLRRHILGWWRGWSALGGYWVQGRGTGKALALVVGLLLLLALGTALAPPLKFDALVYHLTLPQDYLGAGMLRYDPDLVYWGMPQLAEVLYTWAIGLAGAPAAAVLGWAAGALALTGILGTVARSLGSLEGWVAVASLLAGFTLVDSLGWAYVDWVAVLYGWVVFSLLAAWGRDRAPRTLGLAGAAAGLGLGVKYTAGVLVLAGVGFLLLEGKRSIREKLLGAGQFGLVATAVSSPWWIKNLIATGNPFYPLLVPAGAMDAARLAAFQGQAAWGSWLDSVFLPWRATLDGLEGSAGFSASIGPLLLGLGAFFWLFQRVDGEAASGVIHTAFRFAVLGLLAWAVAGRTSGLLIQTRLYLAIFPSLAVLAGAGFGGLAAIRWPGVRLGRVVGALVLLVLGLNLAEMVTRIAGRGVIPYLVGARSEGQYLADNLGWYAPAMEAVSDLPPSARALMLWEPRSLHCRPVCDPDETLDRWLSDVTRYPTNTELQAGWTSAGFTHLVFYRPGADFMRSQGGNLRPAEWERLNALLESLPAPIVFGEVYELYPLPP